MIKFIKKNKIKSGYAMLFTVIIVSAISIITAGLINATYKQMILSSLAKDSQIAFYQADTASDCALYAESILKENNRDLFENGGNWTCGDIKLTIKVEEKNEYNIFSEELNESLSPCFRIKTKNDSGKVSITASGYNICNVNNDRTVERTIQINYSE